MGGLEVAALLRENPLTRLCHIVAITGYGQANDFRKTRAAGFDEHLVKPIDPEALIACIVQGRKSCVEAE